MEACPKAASRYLQRIEWRILPSKHCHRPKIQVVHDLSSQIVPPLKLDWPRDFDVAEKYDELSWRATIWESLQQDMVPIMERRYVHDHVRTRLADAAFIQR